LLKETQAITDRAYTFDFSVLITEVTKFLSCFSLFRVPGEGFFEGLAELNADLD